MTTRLDRLLVLLDTGSTPSVRLTAARQLGQIAAHAVQHPSVFSGAAPSAGASSVNVDWCGVDGEWKEIVNLLGRVLPYLRSKSWDTRQAASEAVDAICKAVGLWDPSSSKIKDPPLEPAPSKQADQQYTRPGTRGTLSFHTFALRAVLAEGTILLSCAGKEFDHRSANPRSAESLLAAKRDVAGKLGLGLGSFGFDLDSVGMDVSKEMQDGAQPLLLSDPTGAPRKSSASYSGPLDPPATQGDSKLQSPSAPPTSRSSSTSVTHPGFGHPPRSQPDEELTASVTSTPTSGPLTLPCPQTAPASDVDMVDSALEGLSARERNALKRKRKAMSRSNNTSSPSSSFGGLSSQMGLSHSSRVVDAAPAHSKLRVLDRVGSGATVPVSPTDSRSDSRGRDLGVHGTSATQPVPPLGLSADSAVPETRVKGKTKAKALTECASSSGGEVDSASGSRPASLNLQYHEGEWPFTSFVEVLMIDMFSSQWEDRHGAALGLISVLKTQGCGAGKSVNASRCRNLHQHQIWLEDLSLKLVCLLSLDRFGDYVGDQVVAPVREAGAQGISLVGRWMNRAALVQILRVLNSMVQQDDSVRGQAGYVWQVRHAGLMGMKYLVAVKAGLARPCAMNGSEPDSMTHELGGAPAQTSADRPCMKAEEGVACIRSGPPIASRSVGKECSAGTWDELEDPSELLSIILASALIGLRDPDDDVRAAASGTLLPITNLLVKHIPDGLNELLGVLWDSLGASKDDLSSSVGNIMDLLANLITYPEVLNRLSSAVVGHTLPSLIPQLFPFFRHTISSVRLSVVRAISVFLSMPALPAHSWVDECLLRLTFQNLLVEERCDVRTVSSQVWGAAVVGLLDSTQSAELLLSMIQPHLSGWFDLVSTPRTRKLDASLFFSANRNCTSVTAYEIGLWHNVDKAIMLQDLSLISMDGIIGGRLAASQALGFLMAKLTPHRQLHLFILYLATLMDSEFAFPRMIAATVTENWALEYRKFCNDPLAKLGQIEAMQPVSSRLMSFPLFSGSTHTYAELEPLLVGIRKDTEGLLATFGSLGKIPIEKIPSIATDTFTIEVALRVINRDYRALLPLLPRNSKKVALASLEDRHRKLGDLIATYERDKLSFDTKLDAAAAAAIVALREIPGKISPLIKGLTQSIKNEALVDLQTRSARALAFFIEVCTLPMSPVKNDPTDKIIGNLSTYLCQDESQTPTFVKCKDFLSGIFSAEDSDVRPTSKGDSTIGLLTKQVSVEDVSRARLLRRGAELTLSSLAGKFGDEMIDRIPKLWYCMSEPLLTLFNSGDVKVADKSLEAPASNSKLAQDLLDCLTVLPAVARSLPVSAHPSLVTLFLPLSRAVKSKFAVVRYSIVRCYAQLCGFLPEQGLLRFITDVLPLVGDPTNLAHRQGSVELLSRLVEVLGIKILPYIIFLIVPVLGRMSDSDDDVRYVATNTFASLIKLMPLEAGVPDPPGVPPQMLEKRELERSFLSQLLGARKIEEYKIPVDIKAELRKYQREGISWLAFLAKYQLHGILCDDMGLGKTLQSICILASKHHERAEQHLTSGSPNTVPLPSLVVCPPTLTGHWAHEIRTYATNLQPLLYVGGPLERSTLVKKIKNFDVVVMSYDIVRNDIEALSEISWNYCILDEGHIIKNAKSKLSKAVKLLKSNHRLILSGTPIQNNALELWSLFDFLMPGFLGSEKYFNERFGKPISASRDAKSSSREQEAGALALEALHKQVLPFLLRRLKEDVLDDLPPKIIQDYYCELSPIQKQLYEHFARSQAKDEVQGLLTRSKASGAKATRSPQHIFQALQYLKKLLNHPALVVRSDVPQHQAILSKLGLKGLKDLSHAPKLLALRQILRDCGIGLTTSMPLIETTVEGGGGTTASGGTIPQHRVLVFCQMKQMLDIIENDLFKSHMPTVTYMRMDGSTDASRRHDIVQTFNADPSIDCLLLTTHVGGLGLNLTGADTVIFVEHDWNPMKDLQAMDRAHRLGQKRVVNVYRLITRSTLEEKIMGLQRFKLNIASSIVNQQNSSLGSLDTNQILDLFNISSVEDETQRHSQSRGTSVEGTGLKNNLLEGLEELPPESEYDSMDPAKFLSSL